MSARRRQLTADACNEGLPASDLGTCGEAFRDLLDHIWAGSGGWNKCAHLAGQGCSERENIRPFCDEFVETCEPPSEAAAIAVGDYPPVDPLRRSLTTVQVPRRTGVQMPRLRSRATAEPIRPPQAAALVFEVGTEDAGFH